MDGDSNHFFLIAGLGNPGQAYRHNRHNVGFMVVDCLAKLSDVKRQIIQLYYLLGMTTKSVAEKLGRNVAGVEKALARARGELRECIEAAMRREGRP